MLSIDKPKAILHSVGLALMLASTIGTASILADTSEIPAKLQPSIDRISSEPKNDRLLNEMKVGLDAYALGYSDISKKHFDYVLDNLESYFANDAASAKARSLWYDEGQKDFKGEPYERAMAFYYRGLLYLQDGDIENARAVFQSAALQDAFAEEEQNRCDFALMIYMQAFTSKINKDKSLYEAALSELKLLRPDFKDVANANYLFVVDTGKSPRKLADGVGHSELKYRRGKDFSDIRAEISIDGSKFQPLFPMEDIYWQATSRGGRAFDKILKGKAEFKKNASQFGSTLSDASTVAMVAAPLFVNSNVGNIQGAAAVLGIVGAVSSIIAINANPHADVRYWNNLPDTVHLLPVNIKEGLHKVKFQFRDESGNLLEDLSSSREVKVTSKSHLYWTRSREQLSYLK